MVEESLPFILSSAESSDTDELSELFTNKVKQSIKKRGRSTEKLNIETKKTINKSVLEKESNIERSENLDNDNLSEIKRNKWRTVVINVGGVTAYFVIINQKKHVKTETTGWTTILFKYLQLIFIFCRNSQSRHY